MHNNEKGISLIEVLAAISLVVIVFGVATTLYMSINSQFHTSSKEYVTNAEMQRTISTISNELSQAATAVFINNELRYRRGGKFMSFYYKDGTLTLYEYNISAESNDFINATYSPTTTPERFTNARLITDKLAIPPTYRNKTENVPLGGLPMSKGHTLQTNLQFVYYKTNADGTRTEIADSERFHSIVSVRLIVDYLQ